MRPRAFFALACCVVLGACEKVSEPAARTEPATTVSNSVSPYTIARICADGTKIYGPPPYAIFDGGQFFNIEGAPLSFCEQKR